MIMTEFVYGLRSSEYVCSVKGGEYMQVSGRRELLILGYWGKRRHHEKEIRQEGGAVGDLE